MTETKNTKRALISSVIVLMLCVAMLLGTTYAWFTDSVSSMNNVIQSGNLDVELQYSTDGETWTDVTEDTAIFSEDALWEPGHTEAVALRVKNAGTLAAKYELTTSVYLEKEGTNVYGETFKLSDYLEVYACGPQNNDQVGQILTGLVLGSRDKALGNGTAMAKTAFNKDLAQDDNLDVAEEHIICLAITMPTTVGNEANYKTGTQAPYIQFGVNLYATQAQLEKDSFGSDYDKDATYSKFPVAKVTDNGAQTVTSETLFGGDRDILNGQLALDATYTFVAPDGETDYEDWIADYEVTVDKDLPAGAAILSGQYNNNEPEWQSFITPAVTANTPQRLLGSQGLDLDYATVKSFVGTFNCGVKALTDDMKGVNMKVALKLYKLDDGGNVLASHTVGIFKYKFK